MPEPNGFFGSGRNSSATRGRGARSSCTDTRRPAPGSLANRINVDTGAFASSILTALVLEGRERRFLSTEARSSPRARPDLSGLDRTEKILDSLILSFFPGNSRPAFWREKRQGRRPHPLAGSVRTGGGGGGAAHEQPRQNGARRPYREDWMSRRKQSIQRRRHRDDQNRRRHARGPPLRRCDADF